jgi:cell filamentation protein
MADVHRRLVRAGFLQRLPAREFAREAGTIIGDINYIHPFREGNGRTQAQYLLQLAEQAGHQLDFRRIEPAKWIEASKARHAADYSLMAEAIRVAIVPGRRR